jgi:hypothetical protein
MLAQVLIKIVCGYHNLKISNFCVPAQEFFLALSKFRKAHLLLEA